MARPREVTHRARVTDAGGSLVHAPLRRQDHTPIPSPPAVTSAYVASLGHWSPLTATLAGVTEIVFADGDTIAVWSPA